MKMPRPTKNAEQGTAGQGTAIVPDTASASKTPGCAIGTTMLALVDALNTAVLRAWCASPSGWGRGTIRVKAKAPVLKNTFSEAVATLTAKQGFVMSKFPGLVRLHRSRMVYGRGGGYPQGRPHGFTRVLNHHAHPLRFKTHRVVPKSRKGAPTMHHTNVASANTRAPIILPTTGNTTHFDGTSEQQAFALLQAASDATMAKLYLSRGNIPAARRKAVQLLKALQALEVQA